MNQKFWHKEKKWYGYPKARKIDKPFIWRWSKISTKRDHYYKIMGHLIKVFKVRNIWFLSPLILSKKVKNIQIEFFDEFYHSKIEK